MTIQQNLTQDDIQAKVEHIFASRFNHTLHAYIDITGDLVAGTLLSQIMYWFADGKNRPTVNRDGYFWIAKRREDWMSEIRITSKQYDRAVKILTAEIEMTKEEKEKQWNKGKRREKRYDKEKRLVEVKTFQFYGQPMLHIRPISENINREIKKWKDEIAMSLSQQNKSEENQNYQSVNNGNYQKVNMEISHEEKSYNIYNNINTNTENTDRDYDSETTNNSFSSEKDLQSNSPEGEQSNSFSREKKTAAPKQTKRHSEKEMEDMVNQIPLRTRRIAYEMTGDTNKATRIYECIDYFLGKHKEYSKEHHKVLKDKTLRKIVFKFIEGIEIERDGYTDVYDGLASTSEFVGDYRDVIDEYFNTDFKEKCDYSLVHFSSDTVLTNMMNHVCKEEWCESM